MSDITIERCEVHGAVLVPRTAEVVYGLWMRDTYDAHGFPNARPLSSEPLACYLDRL